MFDSADRLLLGLVTGIVFGFLLQKGRVAKYQVILGQLLLKDWTVLKIMLTAIVVGGTGVYALTGMQQASLHIKPLMWGGVIVGGVLFGIGIALFGYCPGTSVAACGEGRKDAMVGVAGMLTGAGLFVGLYHLFAPVMEMWGNPGKLTLPDVSGISPWIWFVAIFVVTLVVGKAFPHFRSAGSSRQETALPLSGSSRT